MTQRPPRNETNLNRRDEGRRAAWTIFALLKLLNLTGDELWLDRARRFTMHAIEQLAHQRMQSGRGRYKL